MAIKFEDIYRKHFGATKEDIANAKSKNPTPEYTKTSGLDTIKKYEDNFKGSSKAFSKAKSQQAEEEKKKKAIEKAQTTYTDKTVNKYDDGTLWSKAPNREYLNRRSQDELERIAHYSTLSSYEKAYMKEQDTKRNKARAEQTNSIYLSDEYKDNYWKEANKTDYARNQINYYSEKLNEMGIDAPSPKKDSWGDRILRAGISVLQMPDIFGNGIAGFFNKAFELDEERAKEGRADVDVELQKLKRELASARKKGDTKLVSELEAKREELESQWGDYAKEQYSNLGKQLKAGAESSVNTAKSLVTAPFTDKDYEGVVDISTAFNTLRNSQYSDKNKAVGDMLNPIKNSKHEWLNVADDIAINMVGEVLMSKNFEIDGIYDSLKLLRRGDEVKSATNLAEMSDSNINSAKQIVRETNRAKVTNEIGVKFKNLTEDERALKVEQTLDDMAEKKYKSVIKRTGKQTGSLSDDFKGVKIGNISVISPETIENLSKTKFGRVMGNSIGSAVNPVGSVYDAVKSFAEKSLMRDGALGKAMIGGKTQDLKKDILNNFEKFKNGDVDAENVYRAVANKYDIDKLRFVQQFKKDKLKDEVRNLEKQGKEIGINEKNMAEYVEKLEKDGVPTKSGDVPYDVKEGVIDSVGTTDKELMGEAIKSRDFIRNDLKEVKKIIGTENYNKFMESLKVDEGKLEEVKGIIGSKIDNVINKREIQNKRYQTRIDNGTGNVENISKKLEENKELINRLTGRDLEFLPEDIRQSVAHILEGKKLDNVDFAKEIDEINGKAVNKNKAEYMINNGKGNQKIFDSTIRGLSSKDAKIKNIIENTDDVETLIAYEKSINDFIDAHHKNLEDIQGSIDNYSEYVDILGKKFNNVNDMLDFYRSNIGEDFKLDKPLYDLQEAVADIIEDVPEKFDAFKGDSKEVIDFTRKLQQAFMDMGIEEGIINEASDYVSYVFHMLNPELKDSDVVKQLKKQGFENPFNINSLERKLKGSIQEINKTIKNQYGIDNWFETNIFKIFANRTLNHEKFMYKKELADLLNLNSIKFDNLNVDKMGTVEINDLAKRLGIEWESPVLKDGVGMEKRFVDPMQKQSQYGGKYEDDATKLQAEWKSYTGKRQQAIDELILKGNTQKEAEEIVSKTKLSDYEWLPDSEKANVQYSPREKDRMILDQIRQKMFDIQNGKDPDFMVLKTDKVEEEGFDRVVKKDIIEKRLSPEEIKENEVVQEQIFNEMLDNLIKQGLSVDEAIEKSGSGQFLVELRARLKEANQSFELQGYATNQIDLLKDTVTKTSKNVTKDDLYIVDKNVYNQYQRMIDEANGKKVSSIQKVYDKVMNTFKAWALTSTGFHVNNIAGGVINNFMQIGIDSLNPKTAVEVQDMLKELKNSGFDTSKITGTLYGHSKKDIADAIIENGLLSTFMSVENTNLEDFINTGAKSIVENKSPLKKLVGAVNPLDTQNNALVKGSSAFGNWSEQSMKIQNFFAHIKNGEDIEIASDLAKEAMFDYTDMTTFNEGVKKWLFPFVTFLQKNAVFQAEQLAKDPWKGKAILKAKKQSDDMASEKEKFLTPDYLKDGIRVGENKRLNIELPTISFLQSIANPVDLMQQLNPLLKAPYEYITNVQMYSGNEISELNNPVEKLKYSVQTLSPWIRTYQRMGALGVGNKEESKKNPFEKLISGSETRDKSVEWLKGNKLKTFDTDKAEKQRMYEYMNLLEKIYNQSR